MLVRTVSVKITDHGDTVEIQITDYGYCEDTNYEADPWDFGCNLGSTSDFTTIPYVIAKKDYAAFSEATRELTLKRCPKCKHTEVDKMLEEYLTDSYQTWTCMKRIFERANIAYEMKPSIDGFFENSRYKHNRHNDI